MPNAATETARNPWDDEKDLSGIHPPHACVASFGEPGMACPVPLIGRCQSIGAELNRSRRRCGNLRQTWKLPDVEMMNSRLVLRRRSLDDRQACGHARKVRLTEAHRECDEDPRGATVRAQVVSAPTIVRWPSVPFAPARRAGCLERLDRAVAERHGNALLRHSTLQSGGRDTASNCWGIAHGGTGSGRCDVTLCRHCAPADLAVAKAVH